MTPREKLHSVFGELIYVLAMVDGVVQKEEIATLKDLVKDSPFAETIQWSFDYEVEKERDVEELYKRVINYCHEYGPAPEYLNFIDILKGIAAASPKIGKREEELIQSFSNDLLQRFRADIEKVVLKNRS